MHLEASVNHRWQQNRRVAIADAASRPNSWSASSVRSKSRRQTLTHSQSAHTHVSKNSLEQSSFVPKHHSCVQSSDNTVVFSDRDAYEACRKRKSLNGSSTATSPDTCVCSMPPFYLESSPSSEHIDVPDSGPKPLPLHIANRLKERFEKRFMRHYYHSAQVESALSGNRPLSEKFNKYHLVAAFLVNEGNVEAWHIYNQVPVDVGRTSDGTSPGMRNLELTQRRMRLLQRYYSGARQYVVLYVNSNFAEHYLPLGLAVDRTNSRRVPRKSARYHKYSSQSDSSRSGGGIVTRLLSSLLPNTRSRAQTSTDQQTNATFSVVNGTSLSCSSIFWPGSPSSARSRSGRMNQSAPQERADDAPSVNSSSETNQVDGVQGPFNRNTLMQRFLRHVCSSYRRQTPIRCAVNPGSTTSLSIPGQKNNSTRFLPYSNEKESTSSNFAEFSNTSGSSESDCAKVEKQKECLKETFCTSEGSDEKSKHAHISTKKVVTMKGHIESTANDIWLPKR